MAQTDAHALFKSLKLNTNTGNKVEDTSTKENDNDAFIPGDYFTHDGASQSKRDNLHHEPEEFTCTPPITIPQDGQTFEHAESPTESSHVPSLEEFIQNRKTSISFNKTVTLDSGQRQSIADPLEKTAKTRERGRSLLQAMAEDRKRQERAQSESDRTQYDLLTGQPLPQYPRAASDEYMEVHRGESRHPLLQATVDELAREAHIEAPTSLTSSSTLSPPAEEVRTPPQTRNEIQQSPEAISSHASSYEERSPWSRHMKFGEPQSYGEGFSRQGSMKSATRQASRQSSRRSTSNSGKSPAASFLRAFSMGGKSDTDRNPSPDREGQTIGDDYVLGKQIGFGGFSVIKEAFQGTNRRLAVKIVRRNLPRKTESENDSAQAEFEHEVDLWRFLKHKHILPLEAVYKTDFATFCFIPLNVGGTLFDLVRANRQGLSREVAIRYSAQLASALRYLHEDARVAHRDVKLENCLLDTSIEGGHVRLCDFGMSEYITSDSYSSPPSPRMNDADRPPQRNMGPSETSTSAFAGGSLEYAAPEVLRASDAPATTAYTVSPAVDIWAFGVCVFALVVGDRPFQNAFQPRVTMSILRGEWDSDRLKGKGGDDVLDLVKGCLTMEPADRFNIHDVVRSKWLKEEMETIIDDDTSGGWRL